MGQFSTQGMSNQSLGQKYSGPKKTNGATTRRPSNCQLHHFTELRVCIVSWTRYPVAGDAHKDASHRKKHPARRRGDFSANSSRLTRPVHFTSDIYAGCGPNNVHKWDWLMLRPSVSYPPTHWQPHPSFPGTKAKAPIWRPKNRFEEDSSLNHTALKCETSILSLLPNHKSNEKVNLWFLTWNAQPSNWPDLRIIGPSSASHIGFL